MAVEAYYRTVSKSLSVHERPISYGRWKKTHNHCGRKSTGDLEQCDAAHIAHAAVLSLPLRKTGAGSVQDAMVCHRASWVSHCADRIRTIPRNEKSDISHLSATIDVVFGCAKEILGGMGMREDRLRGNKKLLGKGPR